MALGGPVIGMVAGGAIDAAAHAIAARRHRNTPPEASTGQVEKHLRSLQQAPEKRNPRPDTLLADLPQLLKEMDVEGEEALSELEQVLEEAEKRLEELRAEVAKLKSRPS
jgi:chromosome segregation ATPase